MKVVIDTNFWIDILRFKLDFSELYDLLPNSHIFTINQVVEELERLAKKKNKDAGFAKLALSFIESNKIQILPAPEYGVDKALMNLSDKETVIATNDSFLRKKIGAKGGKTIYILGKNANIIYVLK